jgi:hypothetical protein
MFIWYQLVESDGQPFKGMRADKISMEPTSMVIEFREAVKIKYNQPGYLNRIVDSMLCIYKNREFFEGNEKPLSVSIYVPGLGETEEDAVIVVVPRLAYSFPYGPVCQKPFYTDLVNASEASDGWIRFDHVIPSSTLDRLYVRESFQIIALSIRPGINKAIITGTPGIGKSWFLIYLLWKLVNAGKQVLFIYNYHAIYFDGQGGVYEITRFPSITCRSFWTDDLWCLIDGKAKQKRYLSEIPVELCTVVYSLSPNKAETTGAFMKPPAPRVFCMPIWTETELAAIAPCFPAAVNWRHRFEILGGIPRHVLEVTIYDPTRLLEPNLDGCDTENRGIVHFLVHVTSAPPYAESSHCYASKTAFAMVDKIKGENEKRKFWALLDSCQDPFAMTLCETVFEKHVIEMLEQGGTFDCYRLVDNNETDNPTETTIVIPPSRKIVVDMVSPHQIADQLYVRENKNDTAVDAWIPGIGAFQMIVGRKSGIKHTARDELCLLGQGAKKLFLLLQPHAYNNFTKQTPFDIDQYALRIPYPNPVLLAEPPYSLQ